MLLALNLIKIITVPILINFLEEEIGAVPAIIMEKKIKARAVPIPIGYCEAVIGVVQTAMMEKK